MNIARYNVLDHSSTMSCSTPRFEAELQMTTTEELSIFIQNQPFQYFTQHGGKSNRTVVSTDRGNPNRVVLRNGNKS